MDSGSGQRDFRFLAIPLNSMSEGENPSSGTDQELVSSQETEKLKKSKGKPWSALIQVAIVLGLIIGTSVMAVNKKTREKFLDACDSFRGVAGGEFIYLTIAILLIVAFIPSTFFEITCAYLYGFWIGMVLNATSKIVGSLISFSLGRYCCKAKVRSWALGYSIFFAFEKSMAESWKLLFLFRLGYFPLGLKNYGLSVVKGLTYFRFLMVTFISGAPFTLTFSLTGASLKNLTDALDGEDMDSSRIILLAVALTCTVALVFVLAWKVRQMNRDLVHFEEFDRGDLEMVPENQLVETKNTTKDSEV